MSDDLPLPIELFERVLGLLPLTDQIRLERVNKQWCATLRSFWARHERTTIRIDTSALFVNDAQMRQLSFSFLNKCYSSKSLMRAILNRAGKLIKKIDNCASNVLDIETLVSIGLACPNLEELRLSKMLLNAQTDDVSLAQLVSAQNLRVLVLNSNSSIAVNNQWSHCRPWCIGPICPAVPEYPLGLNSISSNLSTLHLEGVMIASRIFMQLCQRLAPNLENFCFKSDECSMKPTSLVSGLCSLTRLKHLNLGSNYRKARPSCVTSKLDDVSIVEIVNSMPRLETLSLRGAENLSSLGANNLLGNSYAGRNALRFLNLNCCRKVDARISCGVLKRSDLVANNGNANSLLTIFAYLTSIDESVALQISKSVVTMCKVVMDPHEIDESIFFGETVQTAQLHDDAEAE